MNLYEPVFSVCKCLLIAGFVEGAVGQRKEVSAEHLEALELLVLVFHLLLNQLYNRVSLPVYLLSISFFSAGLRDSEIKGSSSRI